MKALNQKGRSPIVINMTQTDWNEALTRPSSMVSTAALILGFWVIILSIVNIVEGAYSPGNKVTWLGFLGLSGDAFAANDTGFVIDDAVFAIFGIILIGAGDYGMKKANTQLDDGGNASSRGAVSWILDLPNSDFVKNIIKAESMKGAISSWLIVIGILYYIVWSIKFTTWVDPGVYSVMISLVAFGFALNVSSKVE
jgi:hypothetical protein